VIIRSEPLRSSLLEWALSDTKKQVEKDLPLLRSVQSRTARRLVSFIDTLTLAQQARLLEFSIRRAFAGYSALTDDPLWNQAVKATMEPTEEEDDEFAPSRFNKKTLRQSVLQALSTCLRDKPIKFGPTEELFEIKLGGWRILTIMDFGGLSQLSYTHKLVDRSGLCAAEFIDLQSWMGFGHTKWNEIIEGEQERAAHSIQLIISHFVQEMRPILV